MRQRCRNPKNKNFRHYGGRGIRICKRWDNFEIFLADMGPRPAKGYSIERRDNDKNYCPSNCYWATRKDQGRNTRSVKLNEELVRQIKVFLANRIPQQTIARVYRISKQTVSAINCEEVWT